jgi:hypothetical protein
MITWTIAVDWNRDGDFNDADGLCHLGLAD